MLNRPILAILATVVSIAICDSLAAQVPTAQQIMAEMETRRVERITGVDNYTVVVMSKAKDMSTALGPPAIEYWERAIMEGGTTASVFRRVPPEELARRNHPSGQETIDAMAALGEMIGDHLDQAGISIPGMPSGGGTDAPNHNDDALRAHRSMLLLSEILRFIEQTDFQGRQAYLLRTDDLRGIEGLEPELGPQYETREISFWIDVEHLVILQFKMMVVDTTEDDESVEDDDSVPLVLARSDAEFQVLANNMFEPQCSTNNMAMGFTFLQELVVRRYFVAQNMGPPTEEQMSYWMAEHNGRAVTPCAAFEAQ